MYLQISAELIIKDTKEIFKEIYYDDQFVDLSAFDNKGGRKIHWGVFACCLVVLLGVGGYFGNHYRKKYQSMKNQLQYEMADIRNVAINKLEFVEEDDGY